MLLMYKTWMEEGTSQHQLLHEFHKADEMSWSDISADAPNCLFLPLQHCTRADRHFRQIACKYRRAITYEITSYCRKTVVLLLLCSTPWKLVWVQLVYLAAITKSCLLSETCIPFQIKTLMKVTFAYMAFPTRSAHYNASPMAHYSAFGDARNWALESNVAREMSAVTLWYVGFSVLMCYLCHGRFFPSRSCFASPLVHCRQVSNLLLSRLRVVGLVLLWSSCCHLLLNQTFCNC